MSAGRIPSLVILTLAAALAGCTSLGIEADPDRVDFGSLPLGSSDYATVHLVNRGPEVTVVLSGPSSGPFDVAPVGEVLLPQDVAVPVLVQVHGERIGHAEGLLTAAWDGGSLSVALAVELVDQELDADRDGYPLPEDCDDGLPEVHPEAPELCDGIDNNCDGTLGSGEVDADADGVLVCAGDCDDDDDGAYPGAPELCDGIDNNCDGALDESDLDGDGWRTCDGDCDDSDPTIHPGAAELCDGLDNDCDGDVGEDDADLDGFRGCEGDCDDADPAVHPDAAEGCDGLDTDCDGLLPEQEVDVDVDGFLLCAECDDTNATVFPGAVELCDGLDNDCDDVVPGDEVDADGDGVLACDDCDDADPLVLPGVAEACDGIDTDCDGLIPMNEVDADLDGFAPCAGDCDDANLAVHPDADEGCDGLDTDCDGSPADVEADADLDGAMVCAGDCDDADAGTFPGAIEACDGIDNDCDTLVPADETDADGDGARLCDGDCADGDADVYPGATEVCDGLDNDCDGSLLADEVDGDGDGWLLCSGYVDHGAGYAGGGDCDDAVVSIHPGADEGCDGLDTDCDGSLGSQESDVDLDGQSVCDGDCDDADPNVNSSAVEVCDGVDQNCDGVVDDGFDGDGDGVTSCGGDCDDGDPTVSPDLDEVCNGQDDDCDGLVDDADGNVTDMGAWYIDQDGDGYGDVGISLTTCDQPGGYVADDTDCDDDDDDIHPGVVEECNGVDDDCDGAADSEAACGCDVEDYGGHTYLFCESGLTWTGARDGCRSRDDYELVTIDDGAEQSWIQGVIAGWSSNVWWWIGYNDRDARWWEEPDDAWEWVDGSGSSYTHWANNQPDNYSYNEDCAHLYGDGHWNDLNCSVTGWGDAVTYYLCESTVD